MSYVVSEEFIKNFLNLSNLFRDMLLQLNLEKKEIIFEKTAMPLTSNRINILKQFKDKSQTCVSPKTNTKQNIPHGYVTPWEFSFKYNFVSDNYLRIILDELKLKTYKVGTYVYFDPLELIKFFERGCLAHHKKINKKYNLLKNKSRHLKELRKRLTSN